MSIIEARQLSKSFIQAVKEPGLKGAVKHLFTPKHIENGSRSAAGPYRSTR
jgi:ABC-2 type transport system ATP-binding protein